MVKKHFNKEFVMTKENKEDFKNSTKCSIGDNDCVDTDVKAKGLLSYHHITGKYRRSAHRDCNINLNLNQKYAIVFHILKSYDFHLIVQELGKFNLKISVIINGRQKYKNLIIISYVSSTAFNF